MNDSSSRGVGAPHVGFRPGSGKLPVIGFHLEGETSIIARHGPDRSLISSAEGVAKEIEECRLWLGERSDREIALCYRLPSSIDLRPLVGRRLRVTLVREPAPEGAVGQTLTITDGDGRVWMVAHFGGAQGISHKLGDHEVRAALSQRWEGPLVIGRPELQWLVAPGERARLDDRFMIHFVARTAECAAYVIADKSLVR